MRVVLASQSGWHRLGKNSGCGSMIEADAAWRIMEIIFGTCQGQ